MDIPRVYLLLVGVVIGVAFVAYVGFWPMVHFMLRVMAECPSCHQLTLKYFDHEVLEETIQGLKVKRMCIECCTNSACTFAHVESVTFRYPDGRELQTLPGQLLRKVVLE